MYVVVSSKFNLQLPVIYDLNSCQPEQKGLGLEIYSYASPRVCHTKCVVDRVRRSAQSYYCHGEKGESFLFASAPVAFYVLPRNNLADRAI